jgi:hypothetical protein
LIVIPYSHPLGRRILALLILAGLALPAAAAASTGSIEGPVLDPTLTAASVGGFDASFDKCEIVAAPGAPCQWTALAMLEPPTWGSPTAPLGECPANGLLGQPAGARRIWYLTSSAEGAVQSGPLSFEAGGFNDEYLCLYANYSADYPPRLPVPVISSELLAAAVLHNDHPVAEGTPPASPPAPPASPAAVTTPPAPVCGPHKVRRHGRCVTKKPRHHHRRRRRR